PTPKKARASFSGRNTTQRPAPRLISRRSRQNRRNCPSPRRIRRACRRGSTPPRLWETTFSAPVVLRLGTPLYKDMSEHKVTLKWERGEAEFSYQKYPRDHTWTFDGGQTTVASAAPAYLGNPANVDPEEAFVAALASCHMLTFLSIACKQK